MHVPLQLPVEDPVSGAVPAVAGSSSERSPEGDQPERITEQVVVAHGAHRVGKIGKEVASGMAEVSPHRHAQSG